MSKNDDDDDSGFNDASTHKVHLLSLGIEMAIMST